MTAATPTAKSGVRSVEGAPLLELNDVKMHFRTKGDGVFKVAIKP